MGQHIEGLIAAPFTAMNPDGSVNLETIETQAVLMQRNGVKGAFVCGTTGEGMSLTAAERMDIAQRWVAVAPEGFTIVVHVGHTSLEVCRKLAAHAQEIGAGATGAMGPCFYRPGCVEDLVAFCGAVAASAPDLPFYYYHIPAMSGVNLAMVDFLKTAAKEIPNLAGIKFSGEDLMDFGLCRAMDGGRFDMLYGCDELLLCALALGVRGAVGSTYNFAAPLYLRLIEAFDAGDLATARELQRQSMEMVQVLMRTTDAFLPAAKAVMKMVGVDCGPVRSPLRAIRSEQYERLQADLEMIGFFQYCSQ